MGERHGNIFCISGPAGAGKGTLMKELQTAVDDVWLSVSCTTRSPRPGELEGTHYFFVSEEEFSRMAEQGDFLEWAHVGGHRYGTPLAPLQQHMSTGEQVVLEIEPQGAEQVRALMPQAHLIFIMPPSLEELRRRLEHRNTEDADEIERRLQRAEVEMQRKEEYDVQIVNDDLGVAVTELVDCINQFATE